MSELEPNAGTGTVTDETVDGDTIFSPIGLRDVVVAKLLTDPVGGAPTYGAVIPLVGAIDFDFQDNSGDPDAQDYDDGEHDVIMPEPETTGTLEMADLPPASGAWRPAAGRAGGEAPFGGLPVSPAAGRRGPAICIP